MDEQRVYNMIEDYCQTHHKAAAASLCTDCRSLMAYADSKLENCPLSPDKPVCSECWIHCYRAEERAAIKAVMRFAGPRMIYRHPIIALHYLIRKIRSKSRSAASNST
ncbi:MAG: nitrous oxide-stimulated promoter family protein [Spirochaetia bacterium]|nr:nitrous oxide-stimulated promoter family protein [Spirochaetia bacterium]